MIDHKKRKQLALHLRLADGITSNDEFENNILDEVTNDWLPEQFYRSKEAKTGDTSILPIVEASCTLYDDTRNHKLRKSDPLKPEAMKQIARIILSLHSDQEYKWPYFDIKSPIDRFSLKDFLLLMTLGKHYRDRRRAQLTGYKSFKKEGDFDYWPFFKKAAYERQLSLQPFLKGRV
jgi:hypothetical protein